MRNRSAAVMVAATGLALLAPPAAAEIFKCPTPTGKVEYRDYACDGGPATGEKVDTRANTIGTGESLASIRAQDASMKKRMDERRAADERAAEKEREARDRAFYEERAHRDRQAIAEAVRDGNSWNNGAVWWPGYVVPPKHRADPPPPKRVPPPAIVTKRRDG